MSASKRHQRAVVGSPYVDLSRRRQRFVDEYVKCGVGVEAIQKAGFQGRRPDVAASKYLMNPEVKAAIAERRARAIAAAGAREVRLVEELCRLALFNPKDLRDADGNRIALHKLPDAVAAAICSEEFDASGNLVKYRTASKLEALAQLMKYLRIAPEQLQLGIGGIPGAPPITTREVSDLDAARRVAFLFGQALRSAAAAPQADSGDAG